MRGFSRAHEGVGQELEALVARGEVEKHEEPPWYDLQLPDRTMTPEGYALMQESDIQPLWLFEIGLGGANAQRLLTFLKTLQDEPDEEV